MSWNPIGDRTADARRKLDNPMQTRGAGAWGHFQRNQAEWQGAMQMDKFSHATSEMKNVAGSFGGGDSGGRFSGPQTTTSSGGLEFTSPEKREWLGERNRADRMNRTITPALMSAIGGAASSIFGGGGGGGGGGSRGGGQSSDPFADSRARAETLRLEQREDRTKDQDSRRRMQEGRSASINDRIWGGSDNRLGSAGSGSGGDDPFTSRLSSMGSSLLSD